MCTQDNTTFKMGKKKGKKGKRNDDDGFGDDGGDVDPLAGAAVAEDGEGGKKNKKKNKKSTAPALPPPCPHVSCAMGRVFGAPALAPVQGRQCAGMVGLRGQLRLGLTRSTSVLCCVGLADKGRNDFDDEEDVDPLANAGQDDDDAELQQSASQRKKDKKKKKSQWCPRVFFFLPRADTGRVQCDGCMDVEVSLPCLRAVYVGGGRVGGRERMLEFCRIHSTGAQPY